MQRISMTIDDSLINLLDKYMEAHGYANRSEAIRDLIREKLETEKLEKNPTQKCMATLSYVYNHHERELSRRLIEAQHEHFDLNVATLHVHMSHDDCLEVVVLKGDVRHVRAQADSIATQRGVRLSRLNFIPA